MTDSLWDRPLRALLEETASASPTPGGGSIASISGALGLGLLLMALEVTQTKRNAPSLAQRIAAGRALLSELTRHADRDVEAFTGYVHALALPKTTEVERLARSAAKHAAAAEAARAPLAAAEVCLRGLQLARDVSGAVQENVQSDLLGGADLLHGALKALLRTVAINLPMLGDAGLRSALATRVQQIDEQADQLHASLGPR